METTISLQPRLALINIIPFLLAATLFTLPLSSTGKSIGLTLSIICILSIPSYRDQIKRIVTQPFCKSAILLFSLVLFACLWSPASISQKFLIVEKYSKLLYLPILIVGFQTKQSRAFGIAGFLGAMFITCVLSVLTHHGFLTQLNLDADHLFRNHIMTGFMVSFAVYLTLLLAYRSNGCVRFVYGLLSLLFTYQILFINYGRTGYVLYLLMMAILALQICNWKQALAGLLVLSTLFCTSYIASPLMKNRVDAIFTDIYDYHHDNKNTDIGLRFQFHEFAQDIFLRNPLIGKGTGSFSHLFAVENPVPFWSRPLLEPHSQYWLIASEMGVLGLLALISFFYYLIRASLALEQMKFIALAMIVPFLLGNYSDSLLLYSGSGYFFIIFIALCFGEMITDDKKILN